MNNHLTLHAVLRSRYRGIPQAAIDATLDYAIAENTTVLRAISMAGGFSKFGSSSRVKVLRPKDGEAGYETLKIDIKKGMNGDSKEDILLKAGDMVVVSEGIF